MSARSAAHRRPEEPATVAGRPVDASMTLITSMMQRPLDPGYAAAAEQRRAEGLPAATSVHTRTMLVAAVVTGLLLTVAAQSLRGKETTAGRARAELVEQIEARRGAADRRARTVQQLQAEVSRAQARSLGAQRQGALAEQLAVLETAAGAAALAGPGLRIVLDDSPSDRSDVSGSDPRSGPSATEGRVLARDLQMVTNGLWEAGAEAIAVNGQRLTARSAIRFAGEAILVNFRPLTRPYTVSAIGSPTRLRTGFAESPGGSYALALEENYGIRVDIKTEERVTVPSASSVRVRHAAVPGAASSRARTSQQNTTTAPEPTQ